MRRLAARSSSLARAAALAACSKERAPRIARRERRERQAASAAPAAGQAALGLAEEGRALVKNACLSCHSEEMLAQQRLTPAQWTKIVTKMVGWGANLEPKDTAPLIAWLAATYGP